MKRKIILLLFLGLFILSIFNVNALKTTLPLVGKLIIIDPGHGGKDPGTLYKDIYEKDIVLKISEYLSMSLNGEGATTILTRYGDYDLSKPNATYRKKSDFDNRINLINNTGANLYLSVHLNFLNESQYYGGQVFYTKGNEDLAKFIQLSFNEILKSNRVIKQTPAANYMYSKLKVPGVLIECGFLSNYNERVKLQTKEYQKKIAEVITKGVIAYYN